MGWLNQREVVLAVAGMNGIQDISSVMPAFLMREEKGKQGMTKAGAKSVMLAVKMRVLKGGAIGSLGMNIKDVQELAA